MIGLQEIAYDLAQDVFLRFWQKKDSVDLSRPVFTLLYKIAINLSIDYLRRNKSLSWKDDMDELLFETSSENKNEIINLVQKCLDNLKPKQRAVFILRDLDGLKFEEISDVLGMHVSNLRSNLNLARKRIRELLETKYDINLEYIYDM